jgi:ubiquinone/menaquinone biosynthesis C-methylase UbiE
MTERKPKAPAPVRASYDVWAETYDSDANRTRDLDREVTREVLGDLAIRLVVEIGCGTGKNTTFLALKAERVHALDFSPRMLAIAREKVRQDLEAGRVLFSVADVTDGWPCRGAWADLVTCSLVLEHVADLRPVFAEACGVLAVGGRLFVSELHPRRQARGTKARFERAGATTEIQAFFHPVAEFREAAEAAGLTVERQDEWWHREDDGKPPRLVSFLFRR